MRNAIREQQIWWEVRDRHNWDTFEAWLNSSDHGKSFDPTNVDWTTCERCVREQLVLAAADGLPAPGLALVARVAKYQWSYVDQKPLIRPLQLR